jgi:uncharacterized membrane protein
LVRLVREKRFPRKYLWLLVSGFAVVLLAQNLTARLHLGPSSLILTLLFGLTALGWVLYGFLKREALMRRCGLILAFCATFKLLVLDLSSLDTTLLVIAYLTGGAVLLGISFTYQYFSRKLKQAEEAEASPETQE